MKYMILRGATFYNDHVSISFRSARRSSYYSVTRYDSGTARLMLGV